jgi:hypothetical protein
LDFPKRLYPAYGDKVQILRPSGRDSILFPTELSTSRREKQPSLRLGGILFIVLYKYDLFNFEEVSKTYNLLMYQHTLCLKQFLVLDPLTKCLKFAMGGDIEKTIPQGNPRLGEGHSNGEILHNTPSWASDPMLAITSKENDCPSSEDVESPYPEKRNGTDTSAEPPIERQITTGDVYSVFTVNQKRAIILTGSLASFFSPLSSSIYYPSLPTIASDLHVSDSQINLTVTTYLVSLTLPPREQKPDNISRSSKVSHQW